jgi:hypothetical protein
MQKATVKIGEWIEEGFNLYKNNFGTLVLTAIIALVLTAITIGILAGPMLAGLVIITLQLLRKAEPEPDPGKVFRGFDYFLNAFLFLLVWGIAIFVGSLILQVFPGVGQLISLFFVYAAQAFLMFGIFLIVDKKMRFWPASMESIQTVKTNFWPFLGLSTVASIIGSLGGILLGIGIVLTIPIQVCILAVAYRDVFNEVEQPPAPDFTQSEDPV